MKGDAFWIVIILLVLLVEPLRDSVWNVLFNADPLILILLLGIVWYLGRK